jgi:hypothetical protein
MAEVDADQPPGAHLAAARLHRHQRGARHHQEAERHEEEPVGELRRRGRLTLPERDPDDRQHRRQGDEEGRVHRLEEARREFPPEHDAVGEVAGEEVEAGARLLEPAPEERREHEQHHDGGQALALDAGRRQRPEPDEEPDRPQQQDPVAVVPEQREGAGQGDERAQHARPQQARVLRTLAQEAGVAEAVLAQDVLDDAEGHADACGPEAPVPADLLAERAAHDGPDQRAQVDPHVEDREPRVAPLVVRCVELADDGADVRLEEPGAQDDEAETGIEERKPVEEHAVVAEGDQDPSPQHRLALPQQAIGDPAARDRREVDGGRVHPVDGGGLVGREGETALRQRRRHEEDEERAHPVVAGALPGLGEREGREAARMAGDTARVVRYVRRGDRRLCCHGRQA